MKSFSEILAEVGHTDKNTAHTYGPWYDLWFAPKRESALSILEVGCCVFGGGGLIALGEYFQQARIVGVDNACEPCLRNGVPGTHQNIKLIHADAYSPHLIEKLKGFRFDIIIDDASHEFHNQANLLQALLPNLAPDGFYVVEDCCTDHWYSHLKNIRSWGLQQTIIDQATDKCYDNCLIRFDRV